MNILTGFYDLSILTNENLKEFFIDAIFLAYNVHIDILENRKRERCTNKTIQDMLNIVSVENHNVCINRNIQLENCDYGEIGYCTLTSPDYFLYIYVTLDNLKILTEKYNLIMN